MKLSLGPLLLITLFLNFLPHSVFAQAFDPQTRQSFFFTIPEDDKDTLSHDLETRINFALTGRRYDDAVVNSRWSRAAIGLELKKNFNSYLLGRFAIEQRFTSGAASNYFTVTEGQASPQATLLDEFSLTVKALKNLKGSLGIMAVSLNPIYSSMLIQSWMTGRIVSENKNVTISASQSTPSSSGPSNRAMDEDTLPLFTQGSVLGELKPHERVRIRAAYTSFIFTDPSAKTAEDSKFNGSTILGSGPYMFAYEFAGNEIAADVKFTVGLDDELTFKVAEAKNDKAPNGYNKSNIWRTEYKKRFDKYDLISSVNGFRTESDVIPSMYGIDISGYNNRVGYGVSFKLVIPKQNIGFMAGYTHADVINKEATSAGTQADREVYTLKTEIAYDIL